MTQNEQNENKNKVTLTLDNSELDLLESMFDGVESALAAHISARIYIARRNQ